MRSTIYSLLILLTAFIAVFSGRVCAETEGTVPGRIRLFLFDSGTGSDRTGNNDLNYQIGDTISIDVYARNPELISVSAMEIYLTVDDEYFDIVSQGVNTEKGPYLGHPRPFIQGDFFSGTTGFVQRNGNNTFGDSLTAMDNLLPGWQLNYVEMTGPDVGFGRPVSKKPFGTVCTFQLIAKAPCDSIPIQLDMSQYYLRVSQYLDPYSSDSFSFNMFQTCYISVSGVLIDPPIPDVMLEPGGTDTSIDLDDHIALTSVPDEDLIWSAVGNNQTSVTIDPTTHVVTVTAPLGFRGTETVTFFVKNEGGTFQASDTINVIVDSPPAFTTSLPDTFTIDEDIKEAVLYLPDYIIDTDDSYDSLIFTIAPGPNITYTVAADTLYLQGTANFNGNDTVSLTVADPYNLSDTAEVPVVVRPINDAPVISGLPDITIQRNSTHDINLAEYASDVDGDVLTVSWVDSQNLSMSLEGMMLTIGAEEGFLGSEDVTLTVKDPDELSGSDDMKVTVNPAAKPPVWSPIPKTGFPQGQIDSTLVLWDYIADEDDDDEFLTFEITNNDDVDYLEVNSRNGKLYLYDLDNRAGWDRLTVTAYDPDGNSDTTQFLVFVAPADGTPIVGGIPDTTIVAGTQSVWIDLDNFYYDVDHVDSQMTWTWGRMAGADSSATFAINPMTHMVSVKSIDENKYGSDKIYFTVTDPLDNDADDICNVNVLEDLSRPTLDLPPKVGFVAGESQTIDADLYVTDSLYEKSELTWSWSGDNFSVVTAEEVSQTMTRPISFTGDESWIGWERVAFSVVNPLGGAAQDTLTVFSVSADGTPVAGGLLRITLQAGECMTVALDNYFHDADTPDYAVTWGVSGMDSVTVSIDPLTHVARVCAPSETWQGQETLRFTVADPDNNASSMDVPVYVTGATLRGVLSAGLFRNPMQDDYLDIFMTSRETLNGVPSLRVHLDGDSTNVNLATISDGYFHGRYVLPLDKSLGVKGEADIVMRGVVSDGRSVSDTTRFAYGYLDAVGGKLAFGAMKVSVPEGALAKSAWIVVADEYDPDPGAMKASPAEVNVYGNAYTISTGGVDFSAPVTVSFDGVDENTGAGIYRKVHDGYKYIGAEVSGSSISAVTNAPGTYFVGYDRTAPSAGSHMVADGLIGIPVIDAGAGIDTASIEVTMHGEKAEWRFDTTTSTLFVDCGVFEEPTEAYIEINVADNAGNITEKRIALDAMAVPGQIFVEQNTPNPFNPVTHIPFTLTSDARVKITVYDLLGRRIRTLADSRFEAGRHGIVWDACDDDGRSVSTGVYFCTIVSGRRSVTKKMMFLR